MRDQIGPRRLATPEELDIAALRRRGADLAPDYDPWWGEPLAWGLAILCLGLMLLGVWKAVGVLG